MAFRSLMVAAGWVSWTTCDCEQRVPVVDQREHTDDEGHVPLLARLRSSVDDKSGTASVVCSKGVWELDATKVVITLCRDDCDARTRSDLSQAVTSSAHHAERDGD
ncbi:MAG: hypothetical protein KDA86_11920 [Planctomycetaceae bacterium]|nr:hypothetical protein [Planctomycetaceae bacterium]